MYHLGFVCGFLLSAFLIKHKASIYINIGLFILMTFPVLKFYLPQKAESNETLSIGMLNLLSSNRSADLVHDFIMKENFDLVVFQEVSPFWGRAIKQYSSKYPHYKSVVREGNFGMAVFSKVPLTNLKVSSLCRSGIPTISCLVKWKAQSFQLIAIHPEPPNNQDAFLNRNENFDRVNEIIKLEAFPSIVIGDFNCTSFSTNFNRIRKGTDLKDSRNGLGLQCSWNNDWPLISIPLDHALLSRRLKVIDRRVGSPTGSDHLPVLLKIGI